MRKRPNRTSRLHRLRSLVAALFLTCLCSSNDSPPPKSIHKPVQTNTGTTAPLSQKGQDSPAPPVTDKAQTKAFSAEYAKVHDLYRENACVKAFAEEWCADVAVQNKGRLASAPVNRPDNSLYVAFALLVGAGLDYDLVCNRDILQTLARSYGLTVPQVQNGVWETLTRDWQQILQLVAGMIETHLSLTGPDERREFMANVVHPYMTLISRNRPVPTSVENRVFRAFDKAFPPSGDKKGLLRDYVRAFSDYMGGAAMDGKHDTALNNRLKRYGFRIDMDIDHCVSYELLDYRVPVGTAGIGDILLKKRLGVALLGSDIGQTAYGAKDITLTYEHLLDEANDISIVLSSDSLPKSYHPGADDLWEGLGLDMTVDTANALYRKLLRREFEGKTRAEIANMIVREVCTHELKHKWDETDDPKRQWINIDFEVSAHLAEAIYGGCPVNGLFNRKRATKV